MLSFGYICTFLGRNIVDWLPSNLYSFCRFFQDNPSQKLGYVGAYSGTAAACCCRAAKNKGFARWL